MAHNVIYGKSGRVAVAAQYRAPLIFRICELPHKAEALSGFNFSPACIVMTMPFCRKVPRMRHLSMRVALAIAGAAIISPVQAQIAPQIAAVPQWPPAANYGYGNVYQPYPFPAPTPEDAYRDGTINRWQLERHRQLGRGLAS
jgi:hypothetical protein